MPEMPLDWTKLPADLRYLEGPAERYGKHQFDDDVADFIERTTPAEEAELKEVARRIGADGDKIEAFLDRYRMTEHKEAARVYFLECLIATLRDERWHDSSERESSKREP